MRSENKDCEACREYGNNPKKKIHARCPYYKPDGTPRTEAEIKNIKEYTMKEFKELRKMERGIITATMFLDDPYSHHWEQIMDLKQFCERFMQKYAEEGKKWTCRKQPILGDKLISVMDTTDMNLNDKTYAVVKTKYQEVYANPKKFYELDDHSPTELLVKQLILASLAPIKQRPLDALYILYRQTYDRIKLLEAEKDVRRKRIQ